MPEAPQWARVRGDLNCNVRRGAWYEVVRLTPEEGVLDVNQRTVIIARPSVQVVPIRPQRWSVVARPQDAGNLPLSWGSRCAVCRNWLQHAPLPGHATATRDAPCTWV